jgi:hypothetical protein
MFDEKKDKMSPNIDQYSSPKERAKKTERKQLGTLWK